MLETTSASIFEMTTEQLENSRVVVVDDDDLVTSSLKSFLSLEIDIEPIIFNESMKAVEYIKENEIDLIISDFLMPDLDGIQLLNQVRKYWPQVPRVLLTGYADKENAIKAINEVQVFQYLEKPWENEQLRQIVVNGLEKIFLIRTLSSKMNELEKTQTDLHGLKLALYKAFA